MSASPQDAEAKVAAALEARGTWLRARAYRLECDLLLCRALERTNSAKIRRAVLLPYVEEERSLQKDLRSARAAQQRAKHEYEAAEEAARECAKPDEPPSFNQDDA